MAIDMELEAVLRPPEFPSAALSAEGDHAGQQQAYGGARGDARRCARLLQVVHPTLFIDKDYYNVVGARLYAELLAWQYYRVQNEFCLVGQIDGILVGWSTAACTHHRRE
jgi:hypothetical protein